MGRKKRKGSFWMVLLLLILAVASYFYMQNQPITGNVVNEEYNGETIRVANWNLQVFGTSKAGDEELMNFYANAIDDNDIVFIQEIRDASDTAFNSLCSRLPQYDCKVSSRAGRSTSKEQYGVIYKKGIQILEFSDYNPDAQDRWERPPVKVVFNVSGYEFTAYNIHAKPADVKNELAYLESISNTQGNVIVLGDLNADCSYYNPDTNTEFDSWYWAISDAEDTTVAASSCTYDRILLNSDAKQEFKGSGVYSSNITDEVSDHYLVWVEMGG